MKKTKKTKSTYGTAGVEVLRLLNEYPDMTNREIANDVGCSVGYVYNLRKKMAHRANVLELTLEMEEKPAPQPTSQPKPPEVDSILDARETQYGSFMQSANIAVRLKGIMHNAIAQQDLHLMPDQILALDMIAVKISRILSGNPSYRDSWIDIAGYAQLVADRLGGKAR